MELLPQAIARQLPPLYATEQQGLKALAQVKFFTPDSGWTWYAAEFDGHDLFFGLVSGECTELGYFSLAELQAIRGKLGLLVERDRYFRPTPLEELLG
jgi:hypothetical protein